MAKNSNLPSQDEREMDNGNSKLSPIKFLDEIIEQLVCVTARKEQTQRALLQKMIQLLLKIFMHLRSREVNRDSERRMNLVIHSANARSPRLKPEAGRSF